MLRRSVALHLYLSVQAYNARQELESADGKTSRYHDVMNHVVDITTLGIPFGGSFAAKVAILRTRFSRCLGSNSSDKLIKSKSITLELMTLSGTSRQINPSTVKRRIFSGISFTEGLLTSGRGPNNESYTTVSRCLENFVTLAHTTVTMRKTTKSRLYKRD